MKLTNSYEICFEGWDVSRATNHSILVLIRIHEFVTEVLPPRDGGNCKNFAGSAALGRGLRFLSAFSFVL